MTLSINPEYHHDCIDDLVKILVKQAGIIGIQPLYAQRNFKLLGAVERYGIPQIPNLEQSLNLYSLAQEKLNGDILELNQLRSNFNFREQYQQKLEEIATKALNS